VLSDFVEIMGNIFSSVKSFGDNSEFPQVSELVYSIGIVMLILISYPLSKTMATSLSNQKAHSINRKPFFSYIVIPVLLLLLPVAGLMYFPGHPDPVGGVTARLNYWVCNSRLGFSIGATIALSASISGIILFIRYLVLMPTIMRYGKGE